MPHCRKSHVAAHFFLFQGIHYVGGMTEGETRKIMVDQITEGQVTWVPMDKEYDVVSSYHVNTFIRFLKKICNYTKVHRGFEYILRRSNQ